MKKTYILSLAAALLFAACGQIENPGKIEYLPATEADGTMTIRVTLPQAMAESATKASLSANPDGSLKPSWAAEETISINDQIFTMTACDGRTATFKGNALNAASYDIVYPVTRPVADYEHQKQVGNGDFSHIRYYADIKGVKNLRDVTLTAAWAAANGGSFSTNTVLKFIVTFPEDVKALQYISLDCGEKQYSLALENTTIGSDRTLVAYLEVPQENISFAHGQKVVFSAVDLDGGEIRKEFKPEAQTLYSGRVNEFMVGGEWPTGVKKGKGSMTDPYIITNLSEFDAIHNLLENEVITCFRLDADLDMQEITGWLPFNQENLPRGIYFDGNGHTISNFTITESPKWGSMFGVLHGTVKNLTLKNPVLLNNYAAPSGILCAWVGNSTGTLSGTVENVKIIGGKATTTESKNYFGGMIGNAVNSTIRNCSFDGTVERTVGLEGTYTPVGGLIGWTDMTNTIEGCSTSGSLTCKQGRSCGGVIGYCKALIDLKDCSSSMTITSAGDCVGGITGWTNGGTFKNCHSTCTLNAGITKTGTANSYSGGVVAHISTDAAFENCTFKGKVIASGNYVGGVVGQCNAGTSSFRRCAVEADIKGTSYIGGIVGRTGAKDNVIIENCCSKGSITATGAYLGGIVADLYQGNVMRNCYSTMSLKCVYGIGGLIARASNAVAASILMSGKNYNITVSGCIAWNSSISTTTSGGEDPAGHYSTGPVIGYTAPLNTLSDNYRKPDMAFTYYAEGQGTTTAGKSYTYSGYNDLYDQDNTDSTHELYRKYTDATKDKYYFPYNGKAASAGATVSSVAKTLGWDETVWDLSGSEPVLK